VSARIADRGGLTDCSQAALLALLEALADDRLQAGRPVGAYLAQIVRNQAANARRDEATRDRTRRANRVGVIAATRSLPTDFDAALDAREALRTLAEEDRECLEAYYLDGIGQAELAERMGRSVGGANMWLHRARGRLRAALARAV
jgi:RNA polymerase sigma factor (sigma-70 family)